MGCEIITRKSVSVIAVFAILSDATVSINRLSAVKHRFSCYINVRRRSLSTKTHRNM